jgi:hypothetical protein
MMLLISAANNRSGRVGSNFQLTAITSMLLFVLVLANHRQFERQPLERQYFGAIAEASRIPLLLTEDSSGLTELRLSMPASKEAIRVLRKHQLGVFRSASDTEDLLVVPRGDTYSDGWLGPQATFHVVSDRCKSLFVTLTAADPIDQNSVRIKRNSQLYGTFDFSSSGRQINIPLDPGDDVVQLEFSEYRVPQELGLSPDLRRLSALVDYRCG